MRRHPYLSRGPSPSQQPPTTSGNFSAGQPKASAFSICPQPSLWIKSSSILNGPSASSPCAPPMEQSPDEHTGDHCPLSFSYVSLSSNLFSPSLLQDALPQPWPQLRHRPRFALPPHGSGTDGPSHPRPLASPALPSQSMERRSRAEPWTPSRCHGCPKPRSHAGARLRSCPQQQPAWEQELRSHAMAMEPLAPKPRKQPWPLRSPTRCASAGPSPARSLRSQPFPSSTGPPPRPVHQAGRWPLRFPIVSSIVSSNLFDH